MKKYVKQSAVYKIVKEIVEVGTICWYAGVTLKIAKEMFPQDVKSKVSNKEFAVMLTKAALIRRIDYN